MNRDVRGTSVLVSAGAEKQSLAAVRSLGRAGVHVDVVESKPGAPAFRSRWCRKAWVSPSNHDRDAYVRFLLERLSSDAYATVLACDDLTATYLSEERERFAPRTALALPPRESFACAVDKSSLMRFAAEHGIPTPRTLQPASIDEVGRLGAELGFPVIVKGAHGWGAQHVRLVRGAGELAAAYAEVAALEAALGGDLPMLQEFVRGVGCGFSTLFRHGEARAVFMHRRVSEFDVAAGGTPYSCPVGESVDEDDLRRLGLQLFAALEWHGLGMAEWRRETGTGRLVLMEINPRLVGSTDLAVRAGVDLPLLACTMLRQGDIVPVMRYRTGVRLRWLLPDGLRDLLARPDLALRPDTWRTRSDWSLVDLAPHWMQMRLAAWHLLHH